jgi:hypothetical protein
LGVVLAALAAAPASATPTLEPLNPCYIAATPTQREFITVKGSGFTPLSIVDIFIDNIQQPEPAQANYDSTISGSAIQAPFVEEGQREFTLRVTERANPLNTVTATSKVTLLSVEQRPARARTAQRVRFRGRGFLKPGSVYAHYVFAGKSRRTVRMGMPRGDCGTFSVKRRQFPFKKSPRVGEWTIWFDQEERYSPKTDVRVPLTIRVKPRIRPERAPAR